MLIKFNTIANRIVAIDRMNINLKEMNDNNIVDVGSKVLPMNLQDVFNKATNMLLNDEEMLNNFNKNNKVECHSAIEIKKALSNKAKGEYIDIHFFPVMYKGSNKNKEKAYIDYNLRKALVAVIEMEQTLQELVGYNINIQYMIESEDIKATMTYIGNRLSTDSDMVEEIVDEIVNNIDLKFLLTYADDNKDYIANVKYFIGMDRFLMDKVGFESYNRNEYVQVYIYGGERTDSWSCIKDKNDNLNLFVTPEIKKCLKRIQSLNGGRYLHKFLEEIIGKYYDLGSNSTNWSRIMTYMGRVKDTLPTYYDLESCKNIVKDYFNGLFSLCYVEEPVIEEVEHEVEVTPVNNEEYTTTDNEEVKDIEEVQLTNIEYTPEEIINNEESSEESSILEGLDVGSKEWWEALSK